MEIVIGLDLSLTSTGIAVYDICNDSITTRAVKSSSKQSDNRRYFSILSAIEDIDHYITPESFFFIEGYSFGSFTKSSSVSKLIELGGIVKYSLFNRGRSVIVVPPSTLKKFTTGKGNSKKEDMKVELYKKFKTEFKTSDEADAFALVVLGIKYLDLSSKYSKHTTQAEEACLYALRGQENDTKVDQLPC